ncbi:MAG: hypothetical protein MZV63_05265 [Marinilabiliales bacterium]|nr:hypothetical protein [Marinilabiliales bacterium]
MIREFRQKDAEAGVREVMSASVILRVSQLAVQVAGDLDMRTTLDTMKRMYKYQDYNICLEIVKAMGKMPDLVNDGIPQTGARQGRRCSAADRSYQRQLKTMGEEGVKALVKTHEIGIQKL